MRARAPGRPRRRRGRPVPGRRRSVHGDPPAVLQGVGQDQVPAPSARTDSTISSRPSSTHVTLGAAAVRRPARGRRAPPGRGSQRAAGDQLDPGRRVGLDHRRGRPPRPRRGRGCARRSPFRPRRPGAGRRRPGSTTVSAGPAPASGDGHGFGAVTVISAVSRRAGARRPRRARAVHAPSGSPCRAGPRRRRPARRGPPAAARSRHGDDGHRGHGAGPSEQGPGISRAPDGSRHRHRRRHRPARPQGQPSVPSACPVWTWPNGRSSGGAT